MIIQVALMAQSVARVRCHKSASNNLREVWGSQASRFVLVPYRRCYLKHNVQGSMPWARSAPQSLQVWHQPMCHGLQLLGGRVEELYEAWDFQRKFGSSTRTATEPADAVDGDKPPQFKTFVPGKTRVPKRVIAPAESAPNSHRCSSAQWLHAAPACFVCCHC